MKQNSTSTLPFPFLASINERLKSPFPYYLNDDRKNLMVIAGLSAFVMAFMPLYKPYHNFIEHHTFADLCVFGGITFSVLTVSIIVFPKLFPVTFDPSNWTLQDHLIQTVLQCRVIGIVCIPVNKLYICPQHSLQFIAVHAFTQVALIGVIPATIITMFLKNMMLQQNLREAIRVNRELEKIRHMKKESVPGDKEITLYSDTSETLKLNLPDLLFIRADDNYSTVYWADNGVVQKKLLRANPTTKQMSVSRYASARSFIAASRFCSTLHSASWRLFLQSPTPSSACRPCAPTQQSVLARRCAWHRFQKPASRLLKTAASRCQSSAR